MPDGNTPSVLDRIEANRGVSTLLLPNNTIVRACDGRLVNVLAVLVEKEWRK